HPRVRILLSEWVSNEVSGSGAGFTAGSSMDSSFDRKRLFRRNRPVATLLPCRETQDLHKMHLVIAHPRGARCGNEVEASNRSGVGPRPGPRPGPRLAKGRPRPPPLPTCKSD